MHFVLTKSTLKIKLLNLNVLGGKQQKGRAFFENR